MENYYDIIVSGDDAKDRVQLASLISSTVEPYHQEKQDGRYIMRYLNEQVALRVLALTASRLWAYGKNCAFTDTTETLISGQASATIGISDFQEPVEYDHRITIKIRSEYSLAELPVNAVINALSQVLPGDISIVTARVAEDGRLQETARDIPLTDQ